MRKIISTLGLLAILAGCSSAPPSPDSDSGIGVVPMRGATVTGKVVEAHAPSGVLLKTASDRSFLLPENWEYRGNGEPVAARDLVPGSTVTAVAPARDSRLVAADGGSLVLQSGEDFYSFPVEGLAPAARSAPVMVRDHGQSWQMPLGHAVRDYPSGIVSNSYYQDYQFPEANPYAVPKGLPVGYYGQSPLLLAPTDTGIHLMSLPDTYPVEPLVSHRPVRFNYYDGDVAVSSWDTLGDGQIDLGEVLLAGKLLDVLPGQAVLQVGDAPVAVPWSYVTYNNSPVGDRRFPVGTALGARYYPGVYDLVSYDQGNLTCLYDQQLVQIPAAYLPDRGYHGRVKVKRQKGPWVSMPLASAQPLLVSGDYSCAPSPFAGPLVRRWADEAVWKTRPLRGMPGYQLAAYDGNGPVRVVRGPHRGPRAERDGWVNYGNDLCYQVAGLATPLVAPIWQQPRSQRRVWRPSRQDVAFWQGPHQGGQGNGQRAIGGKGKHHGGGGSWSVAQAAPAHRVPGWSRGVQPQLYGHQGRPSAKHQEVAYEGARQGRGRARAPRQQAPVFSGRQQPRVATYNPGPQRAVDSGRRGGSSREVRGGGHAPGPGRGQAGGGHGRGPGGGGHGGSHGGGGHGGGGHDAGSHNGGGHNGGGSHNGGGHNGGGHGGGGHGGRGRH